MNKHIALGIVFWNINSEFFMKYFSAYYVCCIYSNAYQTISSMEVNNMNPDQTAGKGRVIWVYIVCSIRLPKYISR